MWAPHSNLATVMSLLLGVLGKRNVGTIRDAAAAREAGLTLAEEPVISSMAKIAQTNRCARPVRVGRGFTAEA
jgi:hypothetical protein